MRTDARSIKITPLVVKKHKILTNLPAYSQNAAIMARGSENPVLLEKPQIRPELVSLYESEET